MTADESLAGVLARVRRQVEELAASLPLVAENARREEREACARLAEAQPYYPDTHTGMRQQWVKDQIAAAIRARGDAT